MRRLGGLPWREAPRLGAGSAARALLREPDSPQTMRVPRTDTKFRATVGDGRGLAAKKSGRAEIIETRATINQAPGLARGVSVSVEMRHPVRVRLSRAIHQTASRGHGGHNTPRFPPQTAAVVPLTPKRDQAHGKWSWAMTLKKLALSMRASGVESYWGILGGSADTRQARRPAPDSGFTQRGSGALPNVENDGPRNLSSRSSARPRSRLFRFAGVTGKPFATASNQPPARPFVWRGYRAGGPNLRERYNGNEKLDDR